VPATNRLQGSLKNMASQSVRSDVDPRGISQLEAENKRFGYDRKELRQDLSTFREEYESRRKDINGKVLPTEGKANWFRPLLRRAAAVAEVQNSKPGSVRSCVDPRGISQLEAENKRFAGDRKELSHDLSTYREEYESRPKDDNGKVLPTEGKANWFRPLLRRAAAIAEVRNSEPGSVRSAVDPRGISQLEAENKRFAGDRKELSHDLTTYREEYEARPTDANGKVLPTEGKANWFRPLLRRALAKAEVQNSKPGSVRSCVDPRGISQLEAENRRFNGDRKELSHDLITYREEYEARPKDAQGKILTTEGKADWIRPLLRREAAKVEAQKSEPGSVRSCVDPRGISQLEAENRRFNGDRKELSHDLSSYREEYEARPKDANGKVLPTEGKADWIRPLLRKEAAIAEVQNSEPGSVRSCVDPRGISQLEAENKRFAGDRKELSHDLSTYREEYEARPHNEFGLVNPTVPMNAPGNAAARSGRKPLPAPTDYEAMGSVAGRMPSTSVALLQEHEEQRRAKTHELLAAENDAYQARLNRGQVRRSSFSKARSTLSADDEDDWTDLSPREDTKEGVSDGGALSPTSPDYASAQFVRRGVRSPKGSLDRSSPAGSLTRGHSLTRRDESLTAMFVHAGASPGAVGSPGSAGSPRGENKERAEIAARRVELKQRTQQLLQKRAEGRARAASAQDSRSPTLGSQASPQIADSDVAPLTKKPSWKDREQRVFKALGLSSSQPNGDAVDGSTPALPTSPINSSKAPAEDERRHVPFLSDARNTKAQAAENMVKNSAADELGTGSFMEKLMEERAAADDEEDQDVKDWAAANWGIQGRAAPRPSSSSQSGNGSSSRNVDQQGGGGSTWKKANGHVTLLQTRDRSPRSGLNSSAGGPGNLNRGNLFAAQHTPLRRRELFSTSRTRNAAGASSSLSSAATSSNSTTPSRVHKPSNENTGRGGGADKEKTTPASKDSGHPATSPSSGSPLKSGNYVGENVKSFQAAGRDGDGGLSAEGDKARLAWEQRVKASKERRTKKAQPLVSTHAKQVAAVAAAAAAAQERPAEASKGRSRGNATRLGGTAGLIMDDNHRSDNRSGAGGSSGGGSGRGGGRVGSGEGSEAPRPNVWQQRKAARDARLAQERAVAATASEAIEADLPAPSAGEISKSSSSSSLSNNSNSGSRNRLLSFFSGGGGGGGGKGSALDNSPISVVSAAFASISGSHNRTGAEAAAAAPPPPPPPANSGTSSSGARGTNEYVKDSAPTTASEYVVLTPPVWALGGDTSRGKAENLSRATAAGRRAGLKEKTVHLLQRKQERSAPRPLPPGASPPLTRSPELKASSPNSNANSGSSSSGSNANSSSANYVAPPPSPTSPSSPTSPVSPSSSPSSPNKAATSRTSAPPAAERSSNARRTGPRTDTAHTTRGKGVEVPPSSLPESEVSPGIAGTGTQSGVSV